MHTHCLSILFHDEHAPVYSAHFEEFRGRARLATAGGDNNVRLWKVESTADASAPRLTYLSTLSRHTQAVNVVRFSPRGEILASAGDDGTVLLWVPDESKEHAHFDQDEGEDKESWRVQRTLRTVTNSEIYDLAWSPDGQFLITGSMDNIARIFHEDGTCLRQIAEHNHYVQGVTWDPLNEYVATQSSDRSVHIYHLRNRDGQFSLSTHGRISKIEMSSRRSSGSPVPPDRSLKAGGNGGNGGPALHEHAIASPASSTPGTPTLPMNPPLMTTSRRSSFTNSPSHRNSSAQSSPVIPLPAVKPMGSPKQTPLYKNAHLYHNEAMSSFFRRLTFTPDGSLLITPAGQYRRESSSDKDDLVNTVYIYTRAGLNKPPVAHLPGHKKPAIAIRCCPILYKLRSKPKTTTLHTIDTSSADPAMSSLPPPVSAASGTTESDAFTQPSVFSLPYRMVYAVATQDSVLLYDTQQEKPLAIVSNLHYATFTDLTWSPDGHMLIMTSTDGFCSSIVFDAGELGEIYSPTQPPLHRHHHQLAANNSSPSIRPPSPTRSNSSSSVQTLSSLAAGPPPLPTLSTMPAVTAGGSGSVGTPPHTPMSSSATPSEASVVKRERERESSEEEPKKKRRIIPTLITTEPPQ